MQVVQDFLTVEQARARLRISRATMARLIKSGQLPAQPNILDKRSKLIRVVDIDAILATGAIPAKPIK